MKKYRPVKLCIAILMVLACGVLAILRMDWDLRKICLIILLCVAFLIFLICATYYVQFTEDSVIILHGSRSTTRKYKALYKVRIIPFKDISHMWINPSKRTVTLFLKDACDITYCFGGYFNSSRIIEKFMSIEGVEKQIIVKQ